METKKRAAHVSISCCDEEKCCCRGRQMFINLHGVDREIFAQAPMPVDVALEFARTLLAEAEEIIGRTSTH